MKSLINLIACLLDDAGRLCSVDTARDLTYVKLRAQHEGISFLTITLPDFASEFERALEAERVDSTFFSGWKKRACLPAFLQGFTSLVFDYNGRMLYGPRKSTAIYCVRQICRAFKKIRLECSLERQKAAFGRYRQIETDLAQTPLPKRSELCHFLDCARLLWGEVFGTGFCTTGVVPRHGPGATAEGVSGNGKYAHAVWTDRLESIFPLTDHLFASLNQVFDETNGICKVTILSPQDELPVRVIQVPKTLKTPRTIAIEPVCMQYTQQAVARWIMKMIQTSRYTRDSIRFNDQSTNRLLALQGSSDGSFATIDLSDASDRIPYSIVRQMLGVVPDLWDAVDACRSRSARLPDDSIIELRKFASMGSALCFPIESMYFYTIAIHAIMKKHNLPLTLANIVNASRGLHIFGDDIIVPKGETDTVMRALERFYCRVNTSKSFWNGKFRESCGMDAYDGTDITPVYVREPAPRKQRDSTGVVSWISTSNQFHLAGMWKTADYMKNVVESRLGTLPVVLDTSPGLGWTSFLGIPKHERMCRHTHVCLVKTYKVKARRVTDPLDGYPALLKYFLRVHNQEIDCVLRPLTTDKKHLASSARCGTVSRKRHWVPAY